MRTLAQFEPVHILAGGEAIRREAESLVGDLPNVTLHEIPTNDVWARDHGPMFLVGPPGLPLAVVDWEYNAWGGKYPPFDLDNDVPRQVAELTGRRRFVPGIILEGGAIDGDGAGTIPDDRRVPAQSESQSRSSTAARSSNIWPTTARPARSSGWAAASWATTPTATSTSWPGSSAHGPWSVPSNPIRRTKTTSRWPTTSSVCRRRPTPRVATLEVVPINLPRPLFHDGQRLPASYMNFYVANGVVLVPVFDDIADLAACDTLAALFPDRKIHPLRAVDLAWGLGAYHCITQQQPAIAAERG